MITALCIRRFNVKDNGTASIVEVAGQVDLPAPPPHGCVLTFEDGTGKAGVSASEMRAWPAPRAPGVYPLGLTIRTGTEPGDKLADALAAGWTRIDAT